MMTARCYACKCEEQAGMDASGRFFPPQGWKLIRAIWHHMAYATISCPNLSCALATIDAVRATVVGFGAPADIAVQQFRSDFVPGLGAQN